MFCFVCILSVALQAAQRSTVPPLKKTETSDEEKCRELERKVNDLLEKCARLCTQHDYRKALEVAKEAGKQERALAKKRMDMKAEAGTQLDFTFPVYFNLGLCYHFNRDYQQALTTYQVRGPFSSADISHRRAILCVRSM